MPRKLLNTPIHSSDIIEFANSSSDFGFELRILSKLNELGLRCEHGGTYQDPVTNKPRQFDIRSYIAKNGCVIRMAIECKNLRDNFPLVVFTVPRVASESYHDIIYSYDPDDVVSTDINQSSIIYQAAPIAFRSHGKNLRLEADYSFYPAGEPVGKSCSQVGRDKDNNLTGNDSEVYEKWYQAIHSAHDLVDLANSDWESLEDKECFTLVVPILVVPNDRLWVVRHSSDGNQIEDPKLVERTSIYIDKYIHPSDKLTGIGASLSHLEILTEDGLSKMCSDISSQGELFKSMFPEKGLNRAAAQSFR